MTGVWRLRFAGVVLAAPLCLGAPLALAQQGTAPPAQRASEGAAPVASRPVPTNVGPSGPTRYEREDLRIFGADNQIRFLGESESKAGQQGAPTNNGRNCGTFTTSVYCD